MPVARQGPWKGPAKSRFDSPNTVLTLDRLRLAVVRNTSSARRSGDDSADPVVSAAAAQTQSVNEILRPR
ncbi:MAG: hypothetical protein Q4P32_04200 [Micrococcales bacterium]|nr:hypothetical protein [Micrococcales bacterium]